MIWEFSCDLFFCLLLSTPLIHKFVILNFLLDHVVDNIQKTKRITGKGLLSLSCQVPPACRTTSIRAWFWMSRVTDGPCIVTLRAIVHETDRIRLLPYYLDKSQAHLHPYRWHLSHQFPHCGHFWHGLLRCDVQINQGFYSQPKSERRDFRRVVIFRDPDTSLLVLCSCIWQGTSLCKVEVEYGIITT